MKKVTPEQFQLEYLMTVEAHAPMIAALWETAKNYTTFVRQTLLPEVARRLGLECHSADYYTLDAIFFESKDSDHFNPHTSYAKYIAVAIEHENDARSTYSEMNKLQLFNTPLKVLITYDGGKDGGAQLKRLLAEYGNIARDADVFGDFETSRRALVIVGRLLSNLPNWSFYTYKDRQFVPLP